MPNRPQKICSIPGCGALTAAGLCDRHRRERQQALGRAEDRWRGHSAARGYGPAWRGIRLAVLRAEPLCRFCREGGRIAPATVVDHIDGDARNNEQDNLRSLCKRCHDCRTARDQAWGRKRDREGQKFGRVAALTDGGGQISAPANFPEGVVR